VSETGLAKTGRSVVVTGGSRGIGLATAVRLFQDGNRVAVLSRAGDAPEGLLGVACDVTSDAAVKAALAQVKEAQGAAEVVVSNAGVTDDRLLLRADDASLEALFQTNVMGAFRLARAATGPMIRARFGRLIFVSSVVASTGSAGQSGYAASKAALVGLARSLARELGPRGVTANVVAPGFVETDMTAGLPETRKEQVRGQVPLGRFAAPEEVAAAIAFLAGDSAGYVTGAVLPVDGGLGMGH